MNEGSDLGWNAAGKSIQVETQRRPRRCAIERAGDEQVVGTPRLGESAQAERERHALEDEPLEPFETAEASSISDRFSHFRFLKISRGSIVQCARRSQRLREVLGEINVERFFAGQRQHV